MHISTFSFFYCIPHLFFFYTYICLMIYVRSFKARLYVYLYINQYHNHYRACLKIDRLIASSCSLATFFDMFAFGHIFSKPSYCSSRSILNSDTFDILVKEVPIFQANCCFPGSSALQCQISVRLNEISNREVLRVLLSNHRFYHRHYIIYSASVMIGSHTSLV